MEMADVWYLFKNGGGVSLSIFFSLLLCAGRPVVSVWCPVALDF